MDSDALKKFLRGIVHEKTKIEIEKDIEDQLVSDLYERLENQIYRSLVDALNDSQLEELEKTERTPEQILTFISESGINMQDTVSQTLVRFRLNYLGK